MSTLRIQNSRHKRRSVHQSAAFTLIELLVVVAIVVILMAVLLPSLARARQSVKTTACLANQRSLGQAIIIYAAEYDNAVVPACYSTVFNPGADQLERWPQILIIAGILPNPQNRSSSISLPTKRSVFFCPAGILELYAGLPNSPIDPRLMYGRVSANNSRTDSQTSANPSGPYLYPGAPITVQCWYYLNGTFNASSINGWKAPLPSKALPGFVNGQLDWSPTRMTQIQRSSELVLVADGISFQADRDANFVAGRHGDTSDIKTAQTNILFFDGHAATFSRDALPKDVGTVSEINKLTSSELSQKYPTPVWRLDQ